MNDSFAPNMEPMPGIGHALWRFTPILPLVFGYELSYMEQVAKLIQKLNEVIENDNGQNTNIQRLYDAFVELEKGIKGNGNAWITADMLADGAVTADKIASLAVGFDQLARGSVKGDRIASQSIESYHINNRVIGAAHIMDGNVVNEKIADGHVSTEKLADNAVTTDKIASLAVGFDQLARGSVKGDRIASQSIEYYHLNNGAVGSVHIMNGNVGNEKIADGAVTKDKISAGAVDSTRLAEKAVRGAHLELGCVNSKHIADDAVITETIADGAVTADKIADDALKPLVLYSVRDNVYPQNYLNDSTYGDAALDAIMKGRQILVRVPPEKFVVGDFTPAQCASTDAALFSPVVAYHLPNNTYGQYLYLFYLRDEKQEIDMSAVGLGTVYLPVYGQLKMKVSTRYPDCPLDGLNGQQYYNILKGLDPNAVPNT